MSSLKWFGLFLILLFAVSCSGGSATKPEDLQKLKPSSDKFELQSPAFKNGSVLPKVYSCQGSKNIPPLKWFNAPKGTKSFVLILKDPDAPKGLWTHWVVYNIPSSTTEVQENSNPKGGTLGQNEVNGREYFPPCPPSGTHRYIFDLYALDVEKISPKDDHRAGVESAIKGHVLGKAVLETKFSH